MSDLMEGRTRIGQADFFIFFERCNRYSVI